MTREEIIKLIESAITIHLEVQSSSKCTQTKMVCREIIRVLQNLFYEIKKSPKSPTGKEEIELEVSNESKILTLKEAKVLGLYTSSYKNGDYKYEDKDGTYYLIIDGKKLCRGKFIHLLGIR